MVIIKPHDPSQLKAMEKAIRDSDLGVNPNNEGTQIRIIVPPMTEERRRDMIKVARHKGEEAKVAIRNVRRKAKEELDRIVKDGEAGEDDGRRAEKELDDLTHGSSPTSTSSSSTRKPSCSRSDVVPRPPDDDYRAADDRSGDRRSDRRGRAAGRPSPPSRRGPPGTLRRTAVPTTLDARYAARRRPRTTTHPTCTRPRRRHVRTPQSRTASDEPVRRSRAVPVGAVPVGAVPVRAVPVRAATRPSRTRRSRTGPTRTRRTRTRPSRSGRTITPPRHIPPPRTASRLSDTPRTGSI